VKAKRKADIPQSAPVLRGIVMTAQPHALVRPARAMVVPPVKMHPLPPPARPEPAAEAAGRKASHHEQAFAEGRKEGYAAGRADAMAEGEQALAAAIGEARARAIEEGRLEGLRQGRGEAKIELERAQAQALDEAAGAVRERLELLDRLLKAVEAQAAQRLADAEDDLVALAHETVCRILGREAAQPSALRAMVKHLLVQREQRAQLAVHVHPDDLEALSHEEPGRGDGAWQWVGDNSVQLGGVILRSPEGSLDARLETQLGALRDALLAVRRERRAQLASSGKPA